MTFADRARAEADRLSLGLDAASSWRAAFVSGAEYGYPEGRADAAKGSE